VNPDQVNACFEGFGAVLTLLHVRRIWIDREVRGISTLAVVGFFAWGLWNLFYYPFLDQVYSFVAGIFLALANMLYVVLLIRYASTRSAPKEPCS
jgi:uncharacterized membrane protein